MVLSFGPKSGAAQAPLGKGDLLRVKTVERLLNGPTKVQNLEAVQGELTILDFFATWCVPCIRAVPHLKTLQEASGGKVKVVLVSNEGEDRLQKFLAARKDFLFPIVVDKGNVWNGMFQPPYLPYTAILDKAGRVLAITEAASITPQMIQGWLAAAGNEASATAVAKPQTPMPQAINSNLKSSNSLVRLSQDFLYAARTDAPVTAVAAQLKALPFNSLVAGLATDAQKKAFWINLYNGIVQTTLKKNPDQYKSRRAYFRKKQVMAGGKSFSLDEVEHGILRRSKSKWSLGHFGKWFPSATEKALRVDSLDYRIHFALNCGAKSCPPIAYYNDATLDAQLELATRSYLQSEVNYDSVRNRVEVPKLMSWFRADFGGKRGIISVLKKYGILPQEANPRIVFKPYDWTLSLQNYSNPES